MRGPTDVPCPYCHAPVNVECKTADGRSSWEIRHKGRLRALEQVVKDRDAKAQTVIINVSAPKGRGGHTIKILSLNPYRGTT